MIDNAVCEGGLERMGVGLDVRESSFKDGVSSGGAGRGLLTEVRRRMLREVKWRGKGCTERSSGCECGLLTRLRADSPFLTFYLFQSFSPHTGAESLGAETRFAFAKEVDSHRKRKRKLFTNI